MIEEISIDKISTIKNTRTDINQIELADLMSSIRENGLLQPIAVMPKGDGYAIVYGHRRFVALKKLGRKTLLVGKEVQILDKTLDEKEFVIKNLTENIQRVDNSPLEIAKACDELRKLGLSLGEISVRLSIPRSRINTAIRINIRTPEKIKRYIGYIDRNQNKKGQISATTASKISTMRMKQSEINKLFEKAKTEEFTSNDMSLIEKLVNSGQSLGQALKSKKNISIIGFRFLINKDTKEALGGIKTIRKLVLDIVNGKEKPRPDLIF